jgi:hypothetical protein
VATIPIVGFAVALAGNGIEAFFCRAIKINAWTEQWRAKLPMLED